ncbi:ribonuclease P protein component [Zooshikella harenae]|uniref:Ribonuclease P protein component n=1 Tax=Zooshikella harenae TaxID=2827238 RepID=A0ABS5ZC98_9GAMM|nr:ribonuclease P protein component [Zooshikella harenae]MBU2711683.1 ribonuclease P protein component [Zooshikella harenae]
MRQVFPKRFRLLTSADYRHVFDHCSIKVPHKFLLMLAVPSKSEDSRLGVIVSKKIAKKAVQRNRIKRLFRESYRLTHNKLPAIDIVILARPGLTELENEQIFRLLSKSWQRLNKRAATQK